MVVHFYRHELSNALRHLVEAAPVLSRVAERYVNAAIDRKGSKIGVYKAVLSRLFEPAADIGGNIKIVVIIDSVLNRNA